MYIKYLSYMYFSSPETSGDGPLSYSARSTLALKHSPTKL